MATIVTCTSCSISWPLQSELNIHAVCKECKSLYVKGSLGWKNLPPSAAIPEDLSPIAIGAKGKINDTHFVITGRVKIMSETDYMNHWNMVFSNNTVGILGEAAGTYYLCYPFSGKFVNGLTKFLLGKVEKLSNMKNYIQVGRLHATRLQYEGEFQYLPPLVPYTQLYLSDGSHNLAILNFYSSSLSSIFTGVYMTFEGFNFTEGHKPYGWQRS